MSFFDLFLKKRNKSVSIGITQNKETQAELDIRDRETIVIFKKLLIESGKYKDSIESLINKNIDMPFNAINEGNQLTLDQKKELNINSRKKYGDRYIQSLTTNGLNKDASVDFFKNSYYQAFGIASRKFEISQIQKKGITKCRIAFCNDERDCDAIKKYGNKVFDINSVPDLPLKECTAAYCRCMIVAVLD